MPLRRVVAGTLKFSQPRGGPVMAFGFPASYTEELDLGPENDLRGWAQQALESLGWSIRNESPRKITASTGMTWSSYGERIVIQFHPDGGMSVTSKCVF